MQPVKKVRFQLPEEHVKEFMQRSLIEWVRCRKGIIAEVKAKRKK